VTSNCQYERCAEDHGRKIKICAEKWTEAHRLLVISTHRNFVTPPPPMAQQLLVDQDLIIIETLRSHSDTPHSVGLI
jgi:hypothetical protein